jgi:hypothetical protein
MNPGKTQFIKFTLPLSLLIFFLTSCLKEYTPQFPVYYNVENNTNNQIKVIFNDLVNPYYYHPDSILVTDSVVFINQNEKKTLFVTLYRGYDRGNPELNDHQT